MKRTKKVNKGYEQASYFVTCTSICLTKKPKKKMANDFEISNDFANFVQDLENSEKNENAVCGLDGGECTTCGS